MNLKEKYGLIYDGKMIFPEGAVYSPEKDSATGEVLTQIIRGTAEDVDAAVKSARKAAKSFGALSVKERVAYLNKIAEMFDRDGDELAEMETAINGKTLGETGMQAHGCADTCRYFAACILGGDEKLYTHSSTSFSAIIREPLGVVGLIIPWNAPAMLLMWKLAPALAAGNCVVVKPSSGASLPILEIALRLQEILPAGVVNVVCGFGNPVGNALIANEGIDKISFTGSTKVGRQVAAAGGERIIPVTVELGGKSPIVIFDDADIEKAVQYAMLSTFSSSGAVCVAGSRVIVQDTVYDKVIQLFKEGCARIKVGDPREEGVQMGPIINEKQYKSIMEKIEAGKAEGATLVCGGTRLTGGVYDKGFYIGPTIFGDCTNEITVAKEEIFGPVISVIKFSDEADALEKANDTQYGLGGAVFTKDINRAIRVSKGIKAGTVWVNTYLNSVPGGPFGGYKQSGIGRELHSMTLDAYSNIKNINCDFDDATPKFF